MPTCWPSCLQEGVPRKGGFVLATAKGYTGHQEAGAGVAGLMEASLLIQHAAVPPALHVRHLNPHVHGALRGHAVAVARGGPLGMPSSRADGRQLVLGVSSFGAQGTNAHALVASSREHAAIAADSCSNSLSRLWQPSYCYVAPPVQALLTRCLLHKRPRGRNAAVRFEVSLSVPHLSYLWQYSVHGRPHLSGAALLSLAAAGMAVLAGPDGQAAGIVSEAAIVAPQPLPSPASRKLATAALRVGLDSGVVEVAADEQRLLLARLGLSLTPAAPPLGAGPGMQPRALRAPLDTTGVGSRPPKPPTAAILGSSAGLQRAEVSGYALHPVLLDAALSQAAAPWGQPDTLAAPLTWVRSIAAAVVPGPQLPAGSATVTSTQSLQAGWMAGSAALLPASGPAVHVQGVVVGGHDLPPSSPAPPGAETIVATAAAETAAEEEAEGGIAPDHPLLQMSEEERMLHLQAQVGAGRQPC